MDRERRPGNEGWECAEIKLQRYTVVPWCCLRSCITIAKLVYASMYQWTNPSLVYTFFVWLRLALNCDVLLWLEYRCCPLAHATLFRSMKQAAWPKYSAHHVYSFREVVLLQDSGGLLFLTSFDVLCGFFEPVHTCIFILDMKLPTWQLKGFELH